MRLACEVEHRITRVVSLELGPDNSNRVYPESGLLGPFHSTADHGGREDRIDDFARINTYHVGTIAYLVDRMTKKADLDGTLIDNALVLYGSAMGDSNMHTHERVPLFVTGHAGGALTGGVHVKAPAGTPLANVMLTLLRRLGLDDLPAFGDSAGAFDL